MLSMFNPLFRKRFVVWIILLHFVTWAIAKDIYVAQTASGSGDGGSVANASPVTWLNASSSWGSGSGQVNAGDTVHLCGAINSTVLVQGSGTAGHLLTLLFEPNAKLSQPAGTLLQCNGQSYLVIDGGANGVLENTDNGSALANHVAVSGIYAPMCSNLEVKNLTVQDLYVHTSPADSAVDFGAVGGVYLNGFGGNVSVHDCKFQDVCWVLNMSSGITGASGLSIYNNTFTNYDHAIAGLGGALANPANINIYNNQFGSTSNWDTTGNVYHHDGIHIFFPPGTTLSGMNIYGNLFNGNWGVNNTAHLFIEGDYSRVNPSSVSNVAIWNNVFSQSGGNLLNNGFLAGTGSNWRIQNNTFLGAGVRNSGAIFLTVTGLALANNVFTGVTTYVTAASGTTFSAGGTSYNLYAEATPGGNAPWSLSGTGYNSLGAWQLATGQEAQSLVAGHAYLNTDGTLQATSPAVGAGVNLFAYFTTDKTGVSRSTPWDMGAYKYLGPKAPKNLRGTSR